jgi:N-acetylmuramic acid 6-phosphate (MurNAc-6-P) etherase
MYRWIMNPMHSAPCLAECARAFAQDRPEVAGVLNGASYADLRRTTQVVDGAAQSGTADVRSKNNFVLTAVHESGDLVAAALGDERRRELRAIGAAMTNDEAVSFALANIDPKLLIGPIASIDR